ncbi:MAG: 50S ribosomal protein L1 [Candidatus Hydrogenedentes bacterium]|nr:50S ribosomal protein L1 [Candidatus Hydrogenedentota bacterium]MBI3117999.1 50S ribosomal protein L1 [Candidatus Hydrogenedentota bacterium]
MPKLSKRMQKATAKVDSTRTYTLAECAQLVKENATAKFDETVELAFLLGVDPRHAEQMVRGAVSLPHGTGKKVRVVVFCKQEEQIKAANEAGAEEVGAEELCARVAGGWTDFDAAVAAPDMMGEVGKLGRVLGPRGLMPSPKAGTVTPKVGDAVREIKRGKIEFRVDKNANIHVPVGKASFPAEQIQENASAVIGAIIKARPAAVKGTYLKSCCMSSTMGPGLKMDPSSLTSQFA